MHELATLYIQNLDTNALWRANNLSARPIYFYSFEKWLQGNRKRMKRENIPGPVNLNSIKVSLCAIEENESDTVHYRFSEIVSCRL